MSVLLSVTSQHVLGLGFRVVSLYSTLFTKCHIMGRVLCVALCRVST